MRFFNQQLHILSSLLFISNVNADLLDSVLFVGDSDIYYWGQQGDSDNFIPGSVNVGVSGWTCADVNGKINDWLDQYEPTLIVLKCGTNDMWGSGQVTPEQAFNRFTSVIDKIAATETPVIAMSTKPEIPVLNAGAPAERWQQFNAFVKDYAVSEENIILQDNLPVLSFIDSFEGLLAVGNSPSLYASDIIHLSASGYEYWNTWVDTVIEELMSANGSDCAVWLSDECELLLEMSNDTTSPTFSPMSIQTSDIPSKGPTKVPTKTPTMAPFVVTDAPTPYPTRHDSALPSEVPTTTQAPLVTTYVPTVVPSRRGSSSPSESVTILAVLTDTPSSTPSVSPSSPKIHDSASPSFFPVLTVTEAPSKAPIATSTSSPLLSSPTDVPISSPLVSPTGSTTTNAPITIPTMEVPVLAPVTSAATKTQGILFASTLVVCNLFVLL